MPSLIKWLFAIGDNIYSNIDGRWSMHRLHRGLLFLLRFCLMSFRLPSLHSLNEHCRILLQCFNGIICQKIWRGPTILKGTLPLPSSFLRISKYWWTFLSSGYTPSWKDITFAWYSVCKPENHPIHRYPQHTLYPLHSQARLSGHVGGYWPLINKARCDVLKYTPKNPSIYM